MRRGAYHLFLISLPPSVALCLCGERMPMCVRIDRAYADLIAAIVSRQRHPNISITNGRAHVFFACEQAVSRVEMTHQSSKWSVICHNSAVSTESPLCNRSTSGRLLLLGLCGGCLVVRSAWPVSRRDRQPAPCLSFWLARCRFCLEGRGSMTEPCVMIGLRVCGDKERPRSRSCYMLEAS